MITSVRNPKVQLVRKLLAQARTRRESASFVVEGVRLVEEAIASGWPATLAFYTEGLSSRGDDACQRLAKAGAEVELVSDRVLQAVSDTETSQGILAVFSTRALSIPEALNFVVIADRLRDPGNLGALLRIAAAAGAQAVLLAPGTTDAFAPKVLRAAMGAHFRLPIWSLDWPEIHSLLKTRPQPLSIYLAESRQGIACWSADLRQPCAVIIGGEAEGASSQAHQMADFLLTIPMPGQSESLNAASAAAILLFEVVRQRLSV